MSMSSVPCRRFARCCGFFTMEDIRPSMRADGRHSTTTCQANELKRFVSVRPRPSLVRTADRTTVCSHLVSAHTIRWSK
jgi:hypothetical protein